MMICNEPSTGAMAEVKRTQKFQHKSLNFGRTKKTQRDKSRQRPLKQALNYLLDGTLPALIESCGTLVKLCFYSGLTRREDTLGWHQIIHPI